MKVLITGGNGLVGSALISLLLAQDHEVTIFDRVFDSEFIDEEERSKVKFIRGDLAVFEHILSAVEQSNSEVIFHLGAMLSVPCDADPQLAFRVNGIGTYNILEAARIFHVRQVIYSSTLTTYGKDIPLNKPVDDFTLQRPTTIYGVYKLFSEGLGRYYRDKYGIDFRAVRFSSIVGPGARTKHISVYNAWMIEKSYLGEPYEIFVKPETRTTLTYYKDAANYLLKLSAAPIENIKTICYNLPGQPSTAKDLADSVMKIIPQAKLSFNPEDNIVKIWEKKGFVEYDGSKAREEWCWAQEYSVEEMIIDFGKEIEKLKIRRNNRKIQE